MNEPEQRRADPAQPDPGATRAADDTDTAAPAAADPAAPAVPGPAAPVPAAPASGPALSARLLAVLATALPKGALVLVVLTFGAYAMGVLRDKMLTHMFGAGSALDAYNAAFVLPELAFDVLVAGGLVAPFVPVFLGLKGEDESKAREFGRTVFTLAVLAMIVATAVLFVLAPQTADLIVPAYTGAQRDLYVGLFRAMLATNVLFAASLVLGEILVADRRPGSLAFYAMAPLLYSGGIAAGAFLLGGEDRLGIYGAAAGAIGGALLHFVVRLIGVWVVGFRPRPSLALRTRGLGEFLRLMAPKMVSQPIEPITFLYFTRLASGMAVGSITAYNVARNFQGMPVNVFGMQFAIAAFPALSLAVLDGDRRRFIRTFATNFATIAVLSTITAAGMFVFGEFGIRLLFHSGAFDAEDVAQTALVLSVFTFSVPLESLSQLLARSLYATRNTLLPTIASVAGFIVLVISAEYLAPRFELAAIPAAYAIGMAARFVVLGLALVPRVAAIGREPGPEKAAADSATNRATRLRRSSPWPAWLGISLTAVLLVAGLVYAGGTALNGATLAAEPVTTAWTRERPAVVRPTIAVSAVPATAKPSHTASATATAAATASPTATPAPTPRPGFFSMDLYEDGDFVGEQEDTWCVPAAMQTSMNIIDVGADTSKATQKRLFDLAVSIAGSKSGGAEPEGWADGLTQLGYGTYKVGTKPTLQEAIWTVAKQIRLTNRPAGLMVWYGWHSWVVSGFTASDDPAYTDDFTVTALYIEDVWYPRRSSLWSQNRGGYSRPPDSLVLVNQLPEDFKAWNQGGYPGKVGQFVFVMPV